MNQTTTVCPELDTPASKSQKRSWWLNAFARLCSQRKARCWVSSRQPRAGSRQCKMRLISRGDVLGYALLSTESQSDHQTRQDANLIHERIVLAGIRLC
jgi:hypothetical protein